MITVDNAVSGIGAIGALGTAAYGLVDITKFFGGGVSRLGFGYVRDAVMPYIGVAAQQGTAFGTEQVVETLRANWMNGMAKPDQKAAARSLIRLMLTPSTAPLIAAAAGVNAEHLTTAVQNIFNSVPLTDQDTRVLGAFDVAVGANLDYGYERGDQCYRNGARFVAAVIAIFLAVGGAWLVYGATPRPCGGFCAHWVIYSLIIGMVATPLAPVAKDLASALQTAVKAVGAFKR